MLLSQVPLLTTAKRTAIDTMCLSLAASWCSTCSPQVWFPGGEERENVGVRVSRRAYALQQHQDAEKQDLQCWSYHCSVVGDTSQHGRHMLFESLCPLQGSGCNVLHLCLTQIWRTSSLTRSSLLEACVFPSAQADGKVPGTKQDTLKRNCLRRSV